ncbi:MAG: diguanylate cyclase [Mycobacterium leprae]
MRRAYILYLASLSLLAGIILAITGKALLQTVWPQMLILSLLMIIGASVVLTYLSAGNLDFMAAAILLSFLIAGPDITIWAGAIASIADSLIRSSRIDSMIFNWASFTIMSWVSFTFYTLIGGLWGPAFNHPVQAVAAAAFFMLLNSTLFASGLYFLGSMRFRAAMKAVLAPASIRAYMITMILGILTSYVYVHGGLLWALLIVGLAYALHASLREYFNAVETARSRAQELEVVLNATQGALIMTDPNGLVQVANRQVGYLLGVEPESLIGLPESSAPELQQLLTQTADRNNQVQQVLELVNGPARYVQWYRGAVHNAQGELQGHLQVFTDVTPLKEAEQNLRQLYDSMISVLTAAIDARDSYTHGHSARVSAYAVAIAEQLRLPAADIERLHYSGLLHDIGKLGIDDRVLRKHGALTPSERALMMQHPSIGAEVLQRANVLADLIPGVRWHHEWYSGGGYPDGLMADKIPLDARIIGVADALDAMTSDRPYRSALSVAEAVRRLQASAGVQFDPVVAEAAVAAIKSGLITVQGDVSARLQAAPASESNDAAAHNGMGDGNEGMIRPIHSKELAVFYQLLRQHNDSLDLDTVLQRYIRTLHESVGPNLYLVYLTNSSTGQLELKAGMGPEGQSLAFERDLERVKEAIAVGTTIVTEDTRLLDNYRTADATTKSEVIIPLAGQEERFGALVIEAPLARFFGRDELHLLRAISEVLTSNIKLVLYHERLAIAATHDGLTGVYNHRHFYERLTEEVERAHRYGRKLSVVLLDINGLKAVNDTYGHLGGDEVLRRYGQILRAQVRASDVVARYGGDEFALIMPELDHEAAIQAANRLMTELQSTFLLGSNEVAMPLPAWGVATFPEDGLRAPELVLAADTAMYREKPCFPRIP